MKHSSSPTTKAGPYRRATLLFNAVNGTARKLTEANGRPTYVADGRVARRIMDKRLKAQKLAQEDPEKAKRMEELLR